MPFLTKDHDLVDLKTELTRLEMNNIAEYHVIFASVEKRQVNTGTVIHITKIKALKKYKCFNTTPLILFNEEMTFCEEHGFLRAQKVIAIWEINEINLNGKK